MYRPLSLLALAGFLLVEVLDAENNSQPLSPRAWNAFRDNQIATLFRHGGPGSQVQPPAAADWDCNNGSYQAKVRFRVTSSQPSLSESKKAVVCEWPT